MAMIRRRSHAPIVVVAALWFALYVPLAVLSHLTLRTNAFDLSIFDYALWSTSQGRPGFVPFMGHSLLSHHAMPTLWLLWPVYALLNSPAFLIGTQLAATVGAGLLLYRIALPLVDRRLAVAVVTAFLFSRRSHSAITSVFYVESLEPALVFTAVLAIATGRRWLYWIAIALALGCKEDMALYIGAFGLLQMWQGERRRGAATTALACAWLIVAVLVAIPAARRADGLPPENPFLDARYGEADATTVGGVAGRVLTGRSAGRVLAITSATGLIAWAAPSWLLVAAPGVIANLAARSDTVQSGLIGHYGWPILPWIFLAAVFGARRVCSWKPPVATVFAGLLVLWTAVDSPLWAVVGHAPWKALNTAAPIRAQLHDLRLEGRAVIQPNLIPHTKHEFLIEAAGRELRASAPADVVVLCDIGDLWPLGTEGVAMRVGELSRDPAYRQTSVIAGLHVFERINESPRATKQ